MLKLAMALHMQPHTSKASASTSADTAISCSTKAIEYALHFSTQESKKRESLCFIPIIFGRQWSGYCKPNRNAIWNLLSTAKCNNQLICSTGLAFHLNIKSKKLGMCFILDNVFFLRGIRLSFDCYCIDVGRHVVLKESTFQPIVCVVLSAWLLHLAVKSMLLVESFEPLNLCRKIF